MVDPEQRSGARDECGVLAVFARDEDVARLCYYGLYALQHRGQESAGIAVSDGAHILVTKEMGLVNQVFSEARLAGLVGHLGIGHVRYSTTGASTWDNAQPAFKVTPAGSGIALGHNGNLTNTVDLARRLGASADRCTSDSEVLAGLLAAHADASLEEAIVATCQTLRGAYSLVVMDESTVYGIRDPHGVRPLVIGRLPRGGYVLASETSALDILGAHQLREVEPGEVVAVDEQGLRARRFADATPHFCLFEYVYLARPDHRTPETSVYAARRRMGALLAAEAPVDADLVIPVPDSGTAAAAGYSEASGIPYAEGLVKNRYVGRTFIEPSQSLRESGAAQVHLRITSPPVRHPCFYGIDMATRAELVASGLSIEQIRDFVGADSLAYLSLDALVAASRRDKSSLCRACFDGQYPIALRGAERDGAAARPLPSRT